MDAEQRAELKRLWNSGDMIAWSDAMIDAFPGLIAALEAAEAERDALRAQLAAKNCGGAA